MQIDRIDHLVLTVADLDRTCVFYTQVLGMEVVTFGDGRKALAFGQQKINLHVAGHEHEPKASRPLPGSADLCFITSVSLSLVITHLERHGIAKEVYPISHYLVGGHSQGGFLTYSLLMNFPESMAGAFPISGGVIFQCEPDAYADATLRKSQRAVPLAIVHGKNDPIMAFSAGQCAATLFGEADWPAFRFFAGDTGGHMFARLPVGPAIRWLESHASNDPATLIDFAASQLAQKRYRDAIAALRRARTLNLMKPASCFNKASKMRAT